MCSIDGAGGVVGCCRNDDNDILLDRNMEVLRAGLSRRDRRTLGWVTDSSGLACGLLLLLLLMVLMVGRSYKWPGMGNALNR